MIKEQLIKHGKNNIFDLMWTKGYSDSVSNEKADQLVWDSFKEPSDGPLGTSSANIGLLLTEILNRETSIIHRKHSIT